MINWLRESGFIYLLGAALIQGVGLLLVCSGLWGDRSKGRARCPKCWIRHARHRTAAGVS